jgi:multidrug efflux pump subunit AcrA (membrane-fusion protein)
MSSNGYERPVTPDKTGKGSWISALIAIAVLLGGVGVAVTLVKTKPTAQKETEEAVAPLVHVVPVKVGSQRVRMQLNGQVMPARKVIVLPEVGGRIVWHNKNLVPGGMIEKGEPLVRIDARDYALAVKQQQAQLANQQLALTVETSRGKVASREWELYKAEREKLGLPVPEDKDAEGEDALVLRGPQLDSAKVAVGAAKSNIARAKLALSKTGLTAPFNAFVQNENVEKGQLVGPSSQLATLVGTDVFWVQVSVPVDKLGYINLPHGDDAGSDVLVWAKTGRGRIERRGRVVRLLGDLDPLGRMARVLVEIQDPFGLKKNDADPKQEGKAGAEKELPLLLGSYVRVEIEGAEVDNVAEIPRSGLQPNGKVHLLDSNGELVIKQVTVVWGRPDTVLVRGGLKTGERLVVTTLGAPVAGMKLRASKQPEAGASAAPKKAGGEQTP